MEQYFLIAAARVRSVGFLVRLRTVLDAGFMLDDWLSEGKKADLFRVRFPGAVNSKFTTDMAFITPADLPHIPTYRVMDSDGELLDKSRERPVDVSDEKILTWYKNMMSGMFLSDPQICFWRGLMQYSQYHGCDHV